MFLLCDWDQDLTPFFLCEKKSKLKKEQRAQARFLTLPRSIAACITQSGSYCSSHCAFFHCWTSESGAGSKIADRQWRGDSARGLKHEYVKTTGSRCPRAWPSCRPAACAWVAGHSLSSSAFPPGAARLPRTPQIGAPSTRKTGA